MILIADSGSTKTTWCAINNNKANIVSCETSGINPFLQTDYEIYKVLEKEFKLQSVHYDSVFFYGAGCANQEINKKISTLLKDFFKIKKIFVDTDMIAAARSLCGDEPGIAAILGTGSNSCYYDGRTISRHVPPLGYILGDEGSGTVLGKKLISGILKKQLPDEICEAFFKKYHLHTQEILDQVYLKPFPNRFLAIFTHFIAEHIDHASIYLMVKESFSEFFAKNIRKYPEAAHLPVNFTGSISWYFRNILIEAANAEGFTTGVITKSPVEGLLQYHKIKKNNLM